jgi:hypothetical protein
MYNVLSAMLALYNSLMLKGARRKLHSLEDLGRVFRLDVKLFFCKLILGMGGRYHAGANGHRASA